MSKRTYITQLSMLMFVFAGLFSAGVTSCFADENKELWEASENVCQLIDKGQFYDASIATEKLKIEYTGQQNLPEFLYWIATRYKKYDRFEDQNGFISK